MSRIAGNLWAALSSLRDQKQRAILCALGIAVGTAAIVLLISIGRGVQADVTRQISGLGVNLIVVLPGQVGEGALFSPNMMGLSYLRDSDVEAVRALPGVLRAAPLMFVGGGISQASRQSRSTLIIASGPEWFQIHRSRLAEGQFFSERQSHEPVCVIGSVAKENLFGNSRALNRFVTINGMNLRVVGVTEDPKSEDSLFSMGGFENIAYVPYPFIRESVPNPQLNRIMIETEPSVEPGQLVGTVKVALARRLSKQQFSVVTQKDLMQIVFQIMGLLTSLLAGLTSIALIVGGMGIMTVMLMSVGERSREIGIRKAVGARQTDIFQQFLFESLALAILGGVVGLLLGSAACAILSATTKIKPLLSTDVAMIGLSACVLLGVAFGLLPAMRAARKNPVDSLRSE